MDVSSGASIDKGYQFVSSQLLPTEGKLELSVGKPNKLMSVFIPDYDLSVTYRFNSVIQSGMNRYNII